MKRIFLIAMLGMSILMPVAFGLPQLKETMREIRSDSWSETRKIEFNEYLIYKFQGNSTNTIDVTIEVMSGDSIDMLLLNSNNFTEYQSMMQSGRPREFNSYSTGRGMNLKYITYSFEIPEDGTYYIVEDNTYLPADGGAPGGSVDARIMFSKQRCFECEEAARLERQSIEDANRQAEEARKLREEVNLSKETKSTPGFEMIFSVLSLGTLYLFSRKFQD